MLSDSCEHVTQVTKLLKSSIPTIPHRNHVYVGVYLSGRKGHLTELVGNLLE